MLTALVFDQTLQLLYRWTSRCKTVWQILCALVRASYVRPRAKKKMAGSMAGKNNRQEDGGEMARQERDEWK